MDARSGPVDLEARPPVVRDTSARGGEPPDDAPLPAVRPGSGAMFDRIARRYDLLNRVLSLGLDQRWRRLTVGALRLEAGQRVLDLATGTGDLALAMLRSCPGASVVGVDPSQAMLSVARDKRQRHADARGESPADMDKGSLVSNRPSEPAVGGVPTQSAGSPVDFDRLSADTRSPDPRADRGQPRRAPGLELGAGDAESLPFADGVFDAVAIAFGLRNVPDRERGLREMARVTRAGGRIAILELGEPRGPVLGRLARLHIHVILPRIGALISGAREYRYLEKSIAAFPPPEQVSAMMERSGIEPLEARRLTFGACYLFVGRVRAAQEAAC